MAAVGAAGRRFELVLIPHRHQLDPEDFRHIARRVHARDPRIRARVWPDRAQRWRLPWLSRRPTLVFSTLRLSHFAPRRGRVLQGLGLPKSEEYAALAQAGVPVPRWARLRARERPDLDGFGPYVVVKPDHGARGADVHVYRRERVRWKPRAVRHEIGRGNDDRVVQEFVYTGRWPVSHRVVTLFGTALVAYRMEGSRERPPLDGRYAFAETGGRAATIVSNSAGCRIQLFRDDEVIRFAEAAHAAFPDHPLLGVDVVRDAESGALYVLEVNTGGQTWHLSSPHARRVVRETGGDPYAQLDGLERAARVLAERTPELAC
jgi:hypothetical protein